MVLLRRVPLCLVAALAAAIAGPARAQDLASFEKRVTVKVLPNGLTVLVCERREAPVVSFVTHVDVGSAQEVAGVTGLAHIFEHMAFKGTDRIGTTDYSAEKRALLRVEEAYAAYDAEQRRAVGRDPQRAEALKKAWQDAVAEADRYVVREEYTKIIEREGGSGLNATTGADATRYFYSFPSNRVELWAYLESERFLRPVLREFYKERSVVLEERRMRTDSQPLGRLIEQFIAAAFVAHPYHNPTIGWASDLQTVSATDAARFFERHYVPGNMVVAIVGDVRAKTVMPVLEKYFGRWAERPKPAPLRTEEPPQRAERRIVLRDRAQPFYVEGYHRPDSRHPDDAAYLVIQDLMSTGRTSRLYRTLVRDQKIAAASAGFNGFPGDKYPNLFVVYAVPTPGHTPAELEASIRKEIERLQNEEVSDAELAMVRTRARASLIRKLGSNMGLALRLAQAQIRFGDWRELFRLVDRIQKVSKTDIRRVAREVFVPTNRTVGVIETTTPTPGTPGKGGTP
jgi:predicted Zn-dependent peptidase